VCDKKERGTGPKRRKSPRAPTSPNWRWGGGGILLVRARKSTSTSGTSTFLVGKTWDYWSLTPCGIPVPSAGSLRDPARNSSPRIFVTPASPLPNPPPIKPRSNRVISGSRPVNRSTAIGREIRSGSHSYNRNWRGACEQGCRSSQGRTGRRNDRSVPAESSSSRPCGHVRVAYTFREHQRAGRKSSVDGEWRSELGEEETRRWIRGAVRRIL